MKKNKNNESKRLNKKRKLYKEKYGLDYDEFIKGIKEKKEKNKYGVRCIKEALKLCKPDMKYLLSVFIFIAFGTVSGIISTYLYVYIIDDITLGLYEKAFYSILIYAGCNIITQIFWFFYTRMYYKALNRISFSIKKSLFPNVLQISTVKYNSVSSGEIINRVTYDCDSFASCITTLVDSIASFLESCCYLVVAFIMNVYLGIIMFVLGFIAYLVRWLYLRKKAVLNRTRLSQIGDKNSSVVQEAIRGNRDIKNLNLKNVFNEKQISLAKNYKNSSLDESLQATYYTRSSLLIIAISKMLILVLSIFLIKNGYSSLGIVLGVLSFVWTGFQAFSQLGDIISRTKDSAVYAGRMMEIMNENEYPKEKFGNKNLENFKGEIEFKKVSFSYKKDNALFKNLSFKIKEGECLGIVGKSGQGKSTIINLINKLYEIDKGEISIDGININELTEDCIRNNISVVSQSPYIFDLTIKENLELVNKNATMEDIINACKQAYIHDFIMTLEKGYDSKIGEGGIQLSGGQKQRLAIARALLRNTKILLFDEATSALDNESQDKIKQAINKIKKNKTVIMVAHRLTTVIDCDRILFIDNYKIKADGKHKDLMKNCPEYKLLYNAEDNDDN